MYMKAINLNCSFGFPYFQMPQHRPPKSLVDQTLQNLSEILLDHICREKIQALNVYLSQLPSLVVEQLFCASIHQYVKKCRLKAKSAQENSISVTVMDIVQYGFEEVPDMSILVQSLVTPPMIKLDFSPLLHLGTLTASTFDYFHSQVLNLCLRNVPRLQTLNLKSPNSRTSLPSANSDTLAILSDQGSQLNYLDLSFIIGLKNEDLLTLITGTPQLEYLYIYDCNFSSKVLIKVVLALEHLKMLEEERGLLHTTGKVIYATKLQMKTCQQSR